MAAIACSDRSKHSLSQLALIGSLLILMLLAGCGPKDAGTTVGLDPVEPGSLIVSVSGLPGGSGAALTLTGPNGFTRSIAGSETVTGLTPGSYALTAADADVDGDGYHGLPQSQSVLVRRGIASSASVEYARTTARLAVAINGLPNSSGASIRVTGPGGFDKTVTGAETVKKLVPGSYTLTAAPVVVDGDRYSPTVVEQLLALDLSGAVPTATFDHVLASGRLQLSISGAPAGSTPSVSVAGPHGFATTVTTGQLFKGLDPGSYTISASDLSSGGNTYRPTFAPGATVLVGVNPVAASASVNFAITTGALALTVGGLPAGANANITVSGTGYSHPVTATETMVGLTPGSYTIAAANVTVGSSLYVPGVASQTVSIPAGTTPIAKSVQYTIGAGNLTVSVVGLPGGLSASVDVTGPGGFTHHVTATETVSGLAPGTYTIAAAAVTASGQTFNPSPSSQTKTVSIGATASVSVAYAGSLGNLTVTVTGLPGGTNANVTVIGPGGYNHAVTGTTTLTGLVPGSYLVGAGNVSAGGQTYIGAPASQGVSVSAGATTTATVAYSSSLGNLAVTITGLPGGTSANVTVTGPGGYNQALTATQTLTGLAPGNYTIAAVGVSSGGTTYSPTPVSQTAAVSASATTSKSVAYTAAGALTVTVTGLPGMASASIAVTGPGGYNQAVTATTTLTGLAAGSYTITAGNVASGGSTYGPTPTVQSKTVSTGATATASVSYGVLSGVTLNLQIDGMYLTQAAAKYDGSTPVITGRNAYLRVFVKANQANSAVPTVRVRIYSGAALVQTSTIAAPGSSVPTAINEGTFASSWNLAVPGALVQPNLQILADVDPTNAIAESDDGDNVFPTSGSPLPVDVRTVPTWNVRFVPVLQQANALQGNVSAGNQAQFLVDPLKMLPVASYAADVHAVYTTTAAALQSNDANGAWGAILNELWALRTADASNRYYYGVVKTSYGSGVAGMGYVGSGVNAAIGWDALPSGSGIMAHEVGHNMGRLHSPCGGAASPDPSYPYPGGQIGTYGLDLSTLAVKQPATNFDFMGYCNPDWVSDYTWGKIITYRQSNPNYGPPALPAMPNVAIGLLVWGRITHAGVVLEPAFRVAAPASTPTGSGSHRIEGFDATGTRLFSFPIEPAHSMTAGVQTGHEQHFATVVPLTAAQDQALARIVLVTPDGQIERLSTQPVPSAGRLFLKDPNVSIGKPNAIQTSIRWDGATYPMVLVRDRATGEILSFARGGAATIWSAGRDFEMTFSDGVRSVVQRIR